jgi:hypothetical protein
MKCPLCDKKTNLKHVNNCKYNLKNLSQKELRKLFLEYNYPDILNYESLFDIYINKQMSLPDILKKFKISYTNTLFMLEYYNIQKRSYSDAFLSSRDKRDKTNLERYGAINVFYKNTDIYYKRNETVKQKYGVDNVFQIKKIIKKINDDSFYLEKYGLTLNEFRSINNKKYWNFLSEKEKEDIIKKTNEKRNETFFKKYGKHPKKIYDINEKCKKTCLKKYDSEYFFTSEKFNSNITSIKEKSRNTKIKNKNCLSDSELSLYKVYERNCRNLTNSIKKELFNNWDGYDYYDNEFIKDYLNLKWYDKNYPTIDHKISVYYGFTNNLSVQDICDINNLCITKRRINSAKGKNINYENIS